MDPIIWWSTVVLVVTAAALDMIYRRIPNWLVMPFLVAGLVFVAESRGMPGLKSSLAGVALAAAALAPLCRLRAMGMGDLKLCAAVGAWLGFAQMGLALVVTAMAGGLIAVLWAAACGQVLASIDGAGDLVFGFPRRGFRPHPTLRLDNSRARTMPYAPAIAIGTIFSFFC